MSVALMLQRRRGGADVATSVAAALARANECRECAWPHTSCCVIAFEPCFERVEEFRELRRLLNHLRCERTRSCSARRPAVAARTFFAGARERRALDPPVAGFAPAADVFPGF